MSAQFAQKLVCIEVRRVVRVQPGVPSWAVLRDRDHCSSFSAKEDALRYAQRLGREALADGFVPELRVRHAFDENDVRRPVERIEVASMDACIAA